MSLADHILIQDSCEQKPNEIVRGLTADPVRKTYWVYTDQSLFELVVANEDRDVWRIYLEQGKFDLALKYTKVQGTIHTIQMNRVNLIVLDCQPT